MKKPWLSTFFTLTIGLNCLSIQSTIIQVRPLTYCSINSVWELLDSHLLSHGHEWFINNLFQTLGAF